MALTTVNVEFPRVAGVWRLGIGQGKRYPVCL